jgi:hypothetical protein
MKPKLITSVLLGLLIPWSYFLVVTVGPIRSYDQSGPESIGPAGLAGFIEFEGIVGSILIYSKATIVCALLVFIICTIYDVIAKRYDKKP